MKRTNAAYGGIPVRGAAPKLSDQAEKNIQVDEKPPDMRQQDLIAQISGEECETEWIKSRKDSRRLEMSGVNFVKRAGTFSFDGREKPRRN